jgi:hypothetical protein
VTLTGSPTAGTFTLTYNSQTTAGIAYNATASAVRGLGGAVRPVAGLLDAIGLLRRHGATWAIYPPPTNGSSGRILPDKGYCWFRSP